MLILKLQLVSSEVSAFAVSMGEAAKPFDVQCVEVSKLEEASHEMLILKLQPVSFGVSGFAVSIGKLQNLSFSTVFKCQNRRMF